MNEWEWINEHVNGTKNSMLVPFLWVARRNKKGEIRDSSPAASSLHIYKSCKWINGWLNSEHRKKGTEKNVEIAERQW